MSYETLNTFFTRESTHIKVDGVSVSVDEKFFKLSSEKQEALLQTKRQEKIEMMLNLSLGL